MADVIGLLACYIIVMMCVLTVLLMLRRQRQKRQLARDQRERQQLQDRAVSIEDVIDKINHAQTDDDLDQLRKRYGRSDEP